MKSEVGEVGHENLSIKGEPSDEEHSSRRTAANRHIE